MSDFINTLASLEVDRRGYKLALFEIPELYKVTCGDCGQVSSKEWKEACEEGPDCRPTLNYEVESE